jgi:hypothetical protein
MRTIGKVAGLCIVSMLVMGMALAGNAVAAPLWLVCLEGTGLTKYSSNQCLTASGAATSSEGWQSVGLASGKTDAIRLFILTLTLKDTKTPLGESEVQCHTPNGIEGEGELEGPNKGKITAAKVEEPEEKCKGVKVCKETEVEAVEGVNLPWKLELFETESKLSSKILAGISGKEPGWKVKCNTIGGPQTDECLSESEAKSESVAFENRVSSEVLLILGTFKKTGEGKCSIGGAKAAKIEGQFFLEEEIVSPIGITPEEKYDFGELKFEEERDATFTYTNNKATGDWKPRLGAIERKPVPGAPSAFSIPLNTNTCRNATVEPKKTCLITIKFAPKEVKGKYYLAVSDPLAPVLVAEGRGVK